MMETMIQWILWWFEIMSDLSLEQRCSLHGALKHRFPLPESTLIEFVNSAFNLENWIPSAKDGFTFIEFESHELNDNDLNEVVGENLFEDYVVQNQDWFQLSRNEYSKIHSDDEQADFQKIYNDNLDEEIVDDLTTKLLNYRMNSIKDFENTHPSSLIDSILNTYYSNRFMREIPPTILKGIIDHYYEAKDTRFDQLMFSLMNQINSSPSGPLTQITEKSSEPEHIQNDGRMDVYLFELLLFQLIWKYGERFKLGKEKEEHVYKFLPSSIKKLYANIDHLNVRRRFHSPVTTSSYADEESLVEKNFNECKETIDEYFDQVKNGKEEIIHVNHAKDSLILVLLHYNGKEKFGHELEQIFDNLLNIEQHKSKIRHSILFYKYDWCTYGLDREKNLVQLMEESPSNMLKGLIQYLVGASLKTEHPDRLNYLFSSLDAFHGVDSIRYHSILDCITRGGIDDVNQEGKFRIFVPDEPPIGRISSALFWLNQQEFDEAIISDVLESFFRYTNHRVNRLRNRCNSCDYGHVYMTQLDIDCSKDDLSELEIGLDLITSKYRSSVKIANYSSMIKELIMMIEVIKFRNISAIDLIDRDNLGVESAINLIDAINNPVESTIARYDFTTLKDDLLISRFSSLIMRLSDYYFSEDTRLEVINHTINSIKEQITEGVSLIRQSILELILKMFGGLNSIETTEWVDSMEEYFVQEIKSIILNLGEKDYSYSAIVGLHILESRVIDNSIVEDISYFSDVAKLIFCAAEITDSLDLDEREFLFIFFEKQHRMLKSVMEDSEDWVKVNQNFRRLGLRIEPGLNKMEGMLDMMDKMDNAKITGEEIEVDDEKMKEVLDATSSLLEEMAEFFANSEEE